MPSVTGQVHRIFMDPQTGSPTEVSACVFVGPTPANVEIFLLRRAAGAPAHTGAFVSSMLDALAQALTSRREVVVTHNANDATIQAIELR